MQFACQTQLQGFETPSINPYESPEAEGAFARAAPTLGSAFFFGFLAGAASFLLFAAVSLAIEWKDTGQIIAPWRWVAAMACIAAFGGGIAGAILSRFFTVRRR